MRALSAKNVVNAIRSVLGKGAHQLHEPLLKGKEIIFVSDTIKRNFVSTAGEYVNRFEKAVKKFSKSNHAIAVVNGTQAIFVSLKVLGVRKDDEVLVPALTFVGTVNAISYIGAHPHFIDSSWENFGVNCDKLEKYLSKNAQIIGNRCINKSTGNVIKAIVPVHIFGHPCDIEKVIKISKKFKLAVVEDAAEALGSFHKKKHLGTFGDIGCFSFNGNKIITTGGGGMIITNQAKLAKKIKHLTTTAKLKHKWEYIHDEVGYNFRMPSINAALGLAQLLKLRTFLKAKRKLFYKYMKVLKDINGISLFKEPKNAKSNYWLQTLILDKKNSKFKNKILKEFHKKKVFSRPTWQLISDLKPYRNNQKMDLSIARDIYKRSINIPSSQKLIIKNK
jgi:perosamine synthetase|tara:strand:- start:5785 stop:6957 length:1173 start_codon:yes stop_codon:yes gene_type:complete